MTKLITSHYNNEKMKNSDEMHRNNEHLIICL